MLRWESNVATTASRPMSRRRYARTHSGTYKLDKALYALSQSIIEDRFQWVGWLLIGIIGVIVTIDVVLAVVRYGWPGW